MVVLAGQVTLLPAAVKAAGVTAAYSLSEHAGSVQRAIDEAPGQLAALAARAAKATKADAEGTRFTH